MTNFDFMAGPGKFLFRSLSRSLSLILTYLFAYCVIHLHAFAIEAGQTSSSQSTTATSYKVCETKACTDSAETFLSNMDKSVHPCENFYRFACGNFIKYEVLPRGSASIDYFSIVQNNVDKKLRRIMEDKLDEHLPSAFKKMQDYYKVCMDKDQVEKNSENDLRDIMKSLDGWPVLEGKSWNEEKFDWKNTTYKLSKLGCPIESIVEIDVGPDKSDSTKNIIYIDQAQTGVDQELLSKGAEDPIIQAYFKYMIEFAVLFGANRELAQRELNESLSFEIDLSKISLSRVERNDDSRLYTKMKIQDLEKNYKSIPWLEFINKLVQPSRLLTATDEVMVGPKKFFENIGALLNKTPKRAIANYLLWLVAATSSSRMSQRVQNLGNEYVSLYSGKKGRRDHWKACVSKVHKDMDYAVSSLYIRKYFSKKAKSHVSAMVTNIRSAYKRIIQQVNWMDDKTKVAALDKLNAISTFIAYPRELLEDKRIDELYKNTTINPKSYLKTKLGFNAAGYELDFKNLQKPVNKSDWTLHGSAAKVNAYYSRTTNSIEFPAGILQEIFFSEDRPNYLNYGAIGMVIGHEMTHGFDDEGSHYDKHGKFAEWWDPETKAKFYLKAQDIIRQYNNCVVKEVNQNISGELTQGENIADNGGFKEAYQAYSEWAKSNIPESSLPGLTLSARQLFWLSGANMWCSKSTLETLKKRLLLDPHSPEEFRVNVPFSNIPEFAVDYNCSFGSPMNSKTKYGVW